MEFIGAGAGAGGGGGSVGASRPLVVLVLVPCAGLKSTWVCLGVAFSISPDVITKLGF
jgi:hypothetical protein